MKKSSFFLVVLVWLGFFSACSPSSLDKPNKSLLVQRLESIFYQESFTQIPSQIFEVTEFGAKGDGKTLNTQAIQNAIDAAHEVGGGKVTFPPGTYVSGAIFVKSNVELNIPQGVSIIAIQDDKQFPDIWTRIAGIEMEWPAALINIYQQQNVRITGKGIIDGNGKYWWDKFWGDPPRQGGMYVDYTQRGIRWAVDYDCKRVRPVAVYESKDVLLQDFSVKRAGFWTISLTYSERVYVNGLIIRNNIGGYGPSSDGINSDSSKDILVENCDIDCNDDNLCIKAGRDADGLRVNRPAENIVYRNCITRSGHGLFTIGSETSGGVRNVEVYGLEAIGTNIGIRFKSAKVRGGLIENVWFHDIKMKQVNHPFHFELNWYPEYSYPQIPQEFAQKEIPDHWKVMTTRVKPPARGIPEFRNIRLSNITVEAAKEAIYANAFPEKPIHHLSWENVSIKAEKGGEIQYARDWEMDNVFISLKQPDQPIQLIHSEGIKLAPDVSKRIEPIDAEESDATEETFRPTPTQPIIPVHSQSKQPVFEGDTTTFSENPKVYLTLTPNAQINYFEPLGDG
ncbi:MAG: glycoside hydrolase family 28 protein, partial [Bacteroidia bacterium]